MYVVSERYDGGFDIWNFTDDDEMLVDSYLYLISFFAMSSIMVL